MTLEHGFEEYWQRRSRNLKKNVAKWRKRAEGQGSDIKLTQISSVGEMREAVARYGELESRVWKGREGSFSFDGLYGRGANEVDEAVVKAESL